MKWLGRALGLLGLVGLGAIVALRFALPAPPSPATVSKAGLLADGLTELYSVPASANGATRNLLLLVLEDQIERHHLTEMKVLYQTFDDVRIEDVAWWEYAPKLQGVYRTVVRIPAIAGNKDTLAAALSYLEGRSEPYDIALITHGMPNHLAAAAGSAPISYKDIDSWSLPHLRLVFMQSCYGSSLAPDWMRAGAAAVISYPESTVNYFYYGLLLNALRKDPEDIHGAYVAANREVPGLWNEHPLYAALWRRLGFTHEMFLREITAPELITK